MVPVPQLPSLPLPREPLRSHRKALTEAELARRDSALAALQAAEERYAVAMAERQAAIVAALEAHVTVAAAASAVGLTESALSQRLHKSRRRADASP